MAKVIIPLNMPQLRVGGWEGNVQGHDMAQCLDNLEGIFPGIRDGILSPEGQIRGNVTIFVNNTDIMWSKGLKTELQEADEVYILPAIAGG